METICKAKTLEHIGLINEQLNGAWLEADKTVYRRQEAVLEIFFRLMKYEKAETLDNLWFGLKKILRVPVFKTRMLIKNVKRYYFKDAKKIGLYDLCEIEYFHEEKRISFLTGIPLKIEVIVSSLDVTLEMNEVPCKWVKRSSNFFGVLESDHARDLVQ